MTHQSNSHRIDLKDIAKLAGVSPAAVSAAVNNNPSIRLSVETRKKILHIVKEYRYTPLRTARSLSTRRTYQLGFLLSSDINLGLSNEYYSSTLAGVEQVCREHNYQCSIEVYNLSDVDHFVMSTNLEQRGVDGMVTCGKMSNDVIRLLQSKNIPMAFVGLWQSQELKEDLLYTARSDRTNLCPYEYLRSLGHRTIGITGSQPDLDDLHFYTFHTNRLDDSIIAGEESACEFISMPVLERPTAVYGNPHWAISFLRTILAAGLRCPEDVSVISSSDSLCCRLFYPAITAIEDYPERMGAQAAQLLLDVIEKKRTYQEARQYALEHMCEGRLVIRNSTRRLN